MEITVNVTGLDNLANAIFALAKAAGNCNKGNTRSTAGSRTNGNNYNSAEHTTSTEYTARTNNTDCTSGARGTKYSTRS